jgi:ABC-2 type transport system permease protein
VHKIRFIAQKEIYHILRDPRSLFVVLAMPILMTFLYGYAINMDIENVTLAVLDTDRSASSRTLIEHFFASTYFSPSPEAVDLRDPEHLLRSGKVDAILYIRDGFGQAVTKLEEFELGLSIDGSDAQLASAVQTYSQRVLTTYMAQQMPPDFEPPGVRLSLQVLYNPDLKSSHFFVPGLVAIILMMISALLTSITIAREKETGTLEQLLTAPVKPREILIGKLLPYIVIAFLDGVLVLVFAKFVFGVPFVGSQLLLLLFGFVYIATALSIGILISSVVKTQQVAMMLALTVTMLPSVMLSGFIFAIKNMPEVLQAISRIIPATYFIVIIRGTMLKAAGLEVLAWQAAALVLIMVILLTAATKRFSTRIG